MLDPGPDGRRVEVQLSQKPDIRTLMPYVLWLMLFFGSMLHLLSVRLVLVLWLTFFFGAILYFLSARLVIVIAAVVLSAGIALSFVMLVGEAYVYNDAYRRAFFIFGDAVSTLLIFGFLYAFATKKVWLSVLALAATFMSGGKVSLVLLLIMLVAYILIQKRGKERLTEVMKFFGLSLLCALIYMVLIQASLHLMERPAFLSFRESVMQIIAREFAPPDHRTVCNELGLTGCVAVRSGDAIMQRYYSSLGGLWMTLEGGYPGKSYPNTAEKFADFMLAANPWGMNDRYKLTRIDWERMGAVQNPYMRFGSRYGPWLLLAQIGIFLVIVYVAWRNLAKGESDAASVFSIYFIVVILFNQTQPWLVSMSWILVLLGLCACHIVVTGLLRSNLLPVSWQSFWARRLVYRETAGLANRSGLATRIDPE
jgi:hypothetical protein